MNSSLHHLSFTKDTFLAEVSMLSTADMHDVFEHFGIHAYAFPRILETVFSGSRLGNYGSGI